MKAFTKGQTVIHFADYDRKGTWIYTRAIVKSCGVQKMTLENAETGVMMGRDFEPNADRTYEITFQGVTSIRNNTNFTLADMTDAEAEAVCLAHGALTVIDQQAHYEKCGTTSDHAGYLAAIAKARAEIHEPRALKR